MLSLYNLMFHQRTGRPSPETDMETDWVRGLGEAELVKAIVEEDTQPPTQNHHHKRQTEKRSQWHLHTK